MSSDTMNKELIISYLHLIEQFKEKNDKMIDYSTRMKELTQENVDLYNKIKNGDTNPSLNDALTASTDEYNLIKKEKEDFLKEKFKVFFEKCPKSIINMVLEDAVNFELLEHVLSQVDDYKQGNISYNDGLNNGLEFIRKVSNLPDDFFVKQ
jgi:hypothetical protein